MPNLTMREKYPDARSRCHHQLWSRGLLTEMHPAGEFEAMQDAIGTGSLDQAEMLGRLVSRVASLEAAVAESQSVRRDLHNQLVNLRGNVSLS